MDESAVQPAAETAKDKQPPDLLGQFLADRDALCPQCKYNLRNLTSHVCPECGERLELGVRMVEPRQAALLTGLIGLSSAAGLNGLLLIYGVLRFDARDGLIYRFMGVNAGGLIVLGLLLLIWLKNWRWIRSRNQTVRWLLAAACWIAALADLLVFTAFIH